MGMEIGTVDLSPAGDGSQIVDGEEWLKLLRQTTVD
jgi:hypothetical protein